VEAGKKVDPSEYERAWYRLVNSDTSQTIDYKIIKDVQSPDNPNDDAGNGGEEGDENASSNKVTYTILAGRIFYDNPKQRWVYESYHHCLSSNRFPQSSGDNVDPLAQTLADLYHRSEDEIMHQDSEIREARAKVIANEEERKLAAASAAAKKKGPA
jgi:hypothetical protein